jgi:iron-sulfur cluster repair protein YtfE (RIC family)
MFFVANRLMFTMRCKLSRCKGLAKFVNACSISFCVGGDQGLLDSDLDQELNNIDMLNNTHLVCDEYNHSKPTN